MRNPIILSAARLILAGGAALSLAGAPPAKNSRTSPAPHAAEVRLRMIEEARLAARPGDVLFKSGGGMWGVLAAGFSTRDRTYGHVGVVAEGAGGGFVVIHAGGDPVMREGRVMASPFDEFLGASARAGLYRPRLDAPQVTAFLAAAAAAAERRTPFDTGFSLDTDEALYCTELVWRALSAASGADAVPEKSERSGRVYIALDDLQASPFLAPVWRSP